MDWSEAPEQRDQIVLFPTRLDEAVPAGHLVRLLDDILGRVDWSKWEQRYQLKRGQPPIHPRVLASVVLYGILNRIRSSRQLEVSLQVRLDFRWLAEGRSIDHTTISKFRTSNADALKDLFVQIGLIAREMGCLPLETLAFDGTRVRSNNRKTGTRTPERLRELKDELAEKYSKLEAEVSAADAQDEEQLGNLATHALSDELADVERRQQEVGAAIAQLERMEEEGKTLPRRLPTTDPESRVMKNKSGGFAPNYTPTAMVDVSSGFIVSTDVLSESNEDQHLVPSLEDVQQQFGLESPPGEVLADGLMATATNIEECEDRGIDLYSPLSRDTSPNNPAIRDDPSQPVAAKDVVNLPTRTTSRKENTRQFDKAAFVYDAEENCYWCPDGKRLDYVDTLNETRNGHARVRARYKAPEAVCSGCPLRDLCLHGTAKRRGINRHPSEAQLEAHAAKMATEQAQEKYARRKHPGERPFAVIKQVFGARQFLHRGLKKVRQEWTWLSTAFNLQQLVGVIRTGIGPPT